MPNYRWSSAAVIILGLPACSHLPGYSDVETPDVSLAGLRFSEPGLQEQEMTIQLRLKNPNNFDIPVDSLAFALDVNEISFADGLTDQTFTVPSQSDIVIPVTITMPTSELNERVDAVGVETRLNYTLTGEAEISGWFAPTVPFSRQGKLALPRPS